MREARTQAAAHELPTALPGGLALMDVLLLDAIIPSKSNPRTNFDPVKLKELEDSIRQKGVLQPILVRTMKDGKNVELVAGERRVRAARAAGLKEIPAVIRDLTDAEVLEIQVIENLQRDDLHPLEEAEGYRQLAGVKGYDVARIAERIGRSVKYVYDRMKLVSLVKEAKDLFLADRITAGHAILLARLKPKDQARAIDPEGADHHYGGLRGLWQGERQLFGDGDEEDRKDPYANLKAVSVRELQHWIDAHVKLEAPDVDQMLLPETAATLQAAVEEDVKVLRITRNDVTPEELRDGPKVILGRSWMRADGKEKSKHCDHARLAMVVMGEGRGDAFQVCIDKKKCATHWPEHVKAAKAAARQVKKEAGKPAAAGKVKLQPWEIEQQKRREAEKREDEERAPIVKAMPQILDAVAERVKKMPAGANGLLAKTVLDQVAQANTRNAAKEASRVPAGKSAEDLVRHLAFFIFCDGVGYFRPAEFIKECRAFDVDVKKIVAAGEPKPKSADVVKTSKPAKARRAARPSASS
ncbi:MAG TPA: ParB/RepB/Spo0J family partition protein [Candidatus Polarisedimenticolia bacterium]|jgi:ParB family chromosome partitioning protein